MTHPDKPKGEKLSQSQKRRRDLAARDGAFCQECGATEDLTLGHIIPRSKGGRYSLDNLRLLCGPCNQAEGDKSPDSATER
jgi:5-methylcytosine-specific restriction endonuclease McrA